MPRWRPAACCGSARAGCLPACCPLCRYPPVHAISPVAYSALAAKRTAELPPKTGKSAYQLPADGTEPPGGGDPTWLRQLPVDRFGALALQQLIGPAERAGAEEAGRGRVRARVRGLDAGVAVQRRRQRPGVAAPQDRHQRQPPRRQRPDGLAGDLLL